MSGPAGPVSTSPVATRPAFLAFARGAEDMAALRSFAEAHGWASSHVYEGDIATATDYLRQHPSPLVLLVEIGGVDQASAQLDALADVCAPDVKVIITGVVNEYSFYCWLMDLGISSYLLKPLTSQALEGALTKATQTTVAVATKAKEPAKVIGVVGTRGGVGSTSVAACLSLIISRQLNKNTALVDLDPQDGSIAMHMDLEPSRGLRDALEKPDRIDGLFIDRVMTRVTPNFAILSAEEPMGDRVHYHAQACDILLKEIRDKFDVVVLDLPRRFDDFTSQCFRQSGQLVLVTELSLLGLRDTLRMGDAFRERLGLKAPMFVANRVGMAPKHEMPVGEFEKGATVELSASIPFAPDLMISVAGDYPALQSPSSKPYLALRQIVQALLPDEAFPEAPAAKKGFSLFKKGS